MKPVTKVFLTAAFVCMIVFLGYQISHIWWTMHHAPELLGLEFVRADVFQRPEMQGHNYIPAAWVSLGMLSLFIAVLMGTITFMIFGKQLKITN